MPVPATVLESLRSAQRDSVLGREWQHLFVYAVSARSYAGFGKHDDGDGNGVDDE